MIVLPSATIRIQDSRLAFTKIATVPSRAIGAATRWEPVRDSSDAFAEPGFDKPGEDEPEDLLGEASGGALEVGEESREGLEPGVLDETTLGKGVLDLDIAKPVGGGESVEAIWRPEVGGLEASLIARLGAAWAE